MEEDLRVVVDEKLHEPTVCAHTNCILGCIKCSVINRLREVILSLYSALLQ